MKLKVNSYMDQRLDEKASKKLENIGLSSQQCRLKYFSLLYELKLFADIIEIFENGLLNEKLDDYLKRGIIEIAPLAYMRGRTLDNAFVILDEGQNTTHNQMKMFLTRMGNNAKFMINGDPGQIDLPRRAISGLKEANLILKNVKGRYNNNLREMQILIFRNNSYSNERISKFNPTVSEKCKYCNETETIKHKLFFCEQAQNY